MRSTFFGLEIGKTGLSTAQFGLDVTGHNIANVDTAGYTRQRIVQTAYDPFASIGKFAPVGEGLVGGGVRVKILDQIRSAYLDRRFRTESTTFSYWETRTQSLSYIRSFFDNINEKTSINYSMAEFFKSMKVLAEDTISGAPRTLMQTTAMDLAQQLNMIYAGLIDLQKTENKAVETKVGDINRMAKEIAELNKAIYGFEVSGMIANDLRDKRNLIVDKLAEYIDIEYSEYPDPRDKDHSFFELRVAGVTLVDHDKASELGTRLVANKLPDEDGVAEIYWSKLIDGTATAGAALDFTKLTGGQLKAHVEMRDGTGLRADGTPSADTKSRGIPYYIEMMNNLARALVYEINAVHVKGWTDNPSGSQTGILFFDDRVDTTGSILTPQPVPAPGTGHSITIGSVTFFVSNAEELDFDETDMKTWVITGTEYSMTDAQLSAITAKNFGLSQAILDSAYNIACSSREIGRPGDPPELQRGNNNNINALYDLFRKTGIYVEIGGIKRDIGSFDDYGTVIRFDVANTMHSAEQSGETSRLLALAAVNQRTAVAGVSLDEEMVSLVKYQHAYNGAARVITTMDDALDRLINGTGRVGL